MPRSIRIALLTGTGFGFIRDVLLGVSAFAKEGRNWTFEVEAPGANGLASVRRWHPDGVIARIVTKHDSAMLRKLGVPLVCVGNTVGTHLPRVGVDDEAVGTLAANEFIER